MKSFLETLSFRKTTTCLLKVILLTTLIISPNSIHRQLFSQVPTLEWERRYHGTDIGQNYPIALAVDSSGNSYVTGVASILNENQNIVTTKYNSAGVQQWLDLYNGPPSSNSIDWPICINIDKIRNVYVCGYSESAGFGSNDYLIIKYNTIGTRLWTVRYNSLGNFSDTPSDMFIDALGYVYVTGTSYNGIRNDALTIKYNSNGDSVWVRRFNPSNSTAIGSSLVVDESGNVYVSVQYNFALYFIKYNASGVLQWAIQGASIYNIKSAIDNLGYIYIGGTINEGIPISSDFYVSKYNSNGTLMWFKTYNGTGNNSDDIEAIFFNNSNIYVTGYSAGVGSQGDYLTINYNSDGDSLWIRRYNGDENGNDNPRAITADNNGNVYVTGDCESIFGDMVSIKYNSLGVLQWEINYSGGGTDIKLNPLNSNVFILGFTQDSIPNADIITLKYDQLVGINNLITNKPDKLLLSQNYPNPFNPETRIKYQVINGGNVKLNIFDITGKLIKTLINQNQNSGSYEAEWNADKFASGIYFYSLITEEFTETKRMVLIK